MKTNKLMITCALCGGGTTPVSYTHLYLRHVQPQLADHRQGLGREGLVQLDHADIVQCEPRLLQHLADGGHRADRCV